MRTDRTLYTTGMHGGWGGTLYRIVFAADEYIVALNGKAGLYLDALSIVTNKRTLSYGSGGDTPFSFTAPAGHEIVGLYGRAAGLFDNTGAIERVRASVPFTTEPPTGAERPLVDPQGALRAHPKRRREPRSSRLLPPHSTWR